MAKWTKPVVSERVRELAAWFPRHDPIDFVAHESARLDWLIEQGLQNNLECGEDCWAISISLFERMDWAVRSYQVISVGSRYVYAKNYSEFLDRSSVITDKKLAEDMSFARICKQCFALFEGRILPDHTRVYRTRCWDCEPEKYHSAGE